MKRETYSVWKEFEGKTPVWKVQMPKGILTFKTKRAAERVAEVYGK